MNYNYSHLVGIDYESLNCWQLCVVFYKSIFGIDLKHYCEEFPKDKVQRKGIIYSNVGDFEPTDYPEFGALVLIKIRDIESHIAVYVGNGQILHTTEKMGSHVDLLSRWENTVSGYYRIRKKTEAWSN